MVILLEEARALALAALEAKSTCEIAIIDEKTIERDFGWVFFYNSIAFLREGNEGARLFGNAPVIVSRSGRVSRTHTALPTSMYIRAYEELGADRYDAGEWRGLLDRQDSLDDE